MKIPASFSYLNPWRFGDKLFDLKNDPAQKRALNDVDKTLYYMQAMVSLMKEHDAPDELYQRFELEPISRSRELAFAVRRNEQYRFGILHCVVPIRGLRRLYHLFPRPAGNKGKTVRYRSVIFEGKS
ncbi:hypothetical protein O0544_12300 [Edwardsiella anguillarum]|nr:hypothetical protein [Edwardsiella anguillarum]